MKKSGEITPHEIQKEDLRSFGKRLDLEFHNWMPESALLQMDTMLQLLFIGLNGQASWHSGSIQRVRGGRVLSARDAEEAARGISPSETKFDVFSWRTYIRNFDQNGNLVLKDNANVSQDLREKLYQLRVLNLWLGDHQGVHEQRIKTLKQLKEAQRTMEQQVRNSFIAIDQRPRAISQLKTTATTIESLPAERLIITLQSVAAHNQASNQTLGIKPEIETDILWELGDQVFFSLNDKHSKEIFSADMTHKMDTMLLRRLPKRLGQAHEAFETN